MSIWDKGCIAMEVNVRYAGVDAMHSATASYFRLFRANNPKRESTMNAAIRRQELTRR